MGPTGVVAVSAPGLPLKPYSCHPVRALIPDRGAFEHHLMADPPDAAEGSRC